MTGNPWLVILSIGFIISVIGVLVAIGFLIRAIQDLRRLTTTVNDFIRHAEERIAPVLVEAEMALRSARRVSDDVGAVTDSVRGLSDVVQGIAVNLKTFSAMVGMLGGGVSARASGIREGLKTALNVLIGQIRERR